MRTLQEQTFHFTVDADTESLGLSFTFYEAQSIFLLTTHIRVYVFCLFLGFAEFHTSSQHSHTLFGIACGDVFKAYCVFTINPFNPTTWYHTK